MCGREYFRLTPSGIASVSDSDSEYTDPQFTLNPSADTSRHSGTGVGDETLAFEFDGDTETVAALPKHVGDYTIKEQIGSGGMGQVYRAEHGMMARTVALKTLPPSRASQKRAVARFFAEVRAAARVLHPNIVTAFDAGSVGSIYYLVMEYVDGETLSDLVAREGPLSVAEAVRIIRAAAEGLEHAHRTGLVHRDVKPGNIMVSRSGEVKVLDLGLAVFAAEKASPFGKGGLVGTVEYMSPEQSEDSSGTDARSDIYSLGATFYFLLAGRPPYHGDVISQIHSHRHDDPPQLSAVRPDADLRLNQVLQRMMAKRPEERYQSMAELDADLQTLVQGVPPTRSSGTVLAQLRSGQFPSGGARPLSTASSVGVLGIDCGMFHSTAASAHPGGDVVPAALDADGHASIRSAFAWHDEKLVFGPDAWRLRAEHPDWLSHCLQYYIGREEVDRPIAGRKCPPEVLLALLLRHVSDVGWNREGRPAIAAITVPACYDQLHRRSIHTAASIAGLPGCRLIDRPLAAAYSQLMPQRAAADPPRAATVCHWLTVSVAGSAMEVCMLRHQGGRFQCLATTGDWSAGVLAWQQRLVDLAAEDHLARHGVDPRRSLRSAASLQMGCESAVRSLLLQRETQLRFRVGQHDRILPITREMFSSACKDLLEVLRCMVEETIGCSGVDPLQVDRCLLVGTLARSPDVASVIRSTVGDAQLIPVDLTSIACGAAGAVADALHDGVDPVQGCAARDIGILVWDDAKQKHRAATIVPRGAVLPAKTARRMRPSSGSRASTLTFVESANRKQNSWVALGSCKIAEMIRSGVVDATFTLDASGLLHISIGDPQRDGFVLPPMPELAIKEKEVKTWRGWLDSLF